MTTKPLAGFRHVTDKEGKVRVVKRPPRMAPVLARAQKAKADRQEKRLRANAEKARGKG